MKIGIPRGLSYYYFEELYKCFFENLGFEVVTSSTNRDIIKRGNDIANDEMCLSLKIYLGHVDYLKDKCDYIFIPVLKNFGSNDQMCANFFSIYDIINNLFDIKMLDSIIDYKNNKDELKSFLDIGKKLGLSNKKIIKAYDIAKIKYNKIMKKNIINNVNNLNKECKKILLVGHSYIIHDDYVIKEIIDNLKNQDCEVIYSDYFENVVTNKFSKYYSKELYWKFSKENIGSIVLCQNKIDGIVFVSSFPCGIDSLVNELVMRKINIPYLNLVIDDLDASGGINTRIESFVDIIEQN